MTVRATGHAAGLVSLVLLRMRRDRVQVPVWIGSIGALIVFSSLAVAASVTTQAAREDVIRLAVASPILRMLPGVPQGANLDALVFSQIFVLVAVMVAVMNTFLAVRHSRAEEESGRADLIAGTPAARLLPLVAAVLYGGLVNLVVGAVVAVAFAAVGFSPGGAVLAGASLGATGLVFLGVGRLCAAVMRSSRAANGTAVALVGVSFLLRALGDANGMPTTDGLSVTSAWPSWLSAFGWAQGTSPFTTANTLPLLISAAVAGGLVAVVLGVQSVRDIGASILPEHHRRAEAKAGLLGSFGLAWRLQWPAILGWSVTGLAFGMLAGSLGGSVVRLVQSDPSMQGGLASLAARGPGSVIDLFTAAIFSLLGVLAATAAIQSVVRLRQEEIGGSAELLLSMPVQRTRWMLDYLLGGVLAIVLVLASGIGGAAIGLSQSENTADRVSSVVVSGLAQVPAALLMLMGAATLCAFVPRVSISLSWTVLLACVLSGQFGGLFGLPVWVRALSPFFHTSVGAVTDANWLGAVVMVVVAAGLGVAALVGVSRRDMAL